MVDHGIIHPFLNNLSCKFRERLKVMNGWADLMSTRDGSHSLFKNFTFPDKGEYFVENTNRGAYFFYLVFFFFFFS